MQAKSLLSVTDSLKAFTGKWQKLNGGLGTVKLKFTIPEQTPMAKIPYLVEDSQGKKTLGFVDFSTTNMQEVYVNDLGTKNTAIYFIPYLGSLAQENKLYYYSFEVQSLENNLQTEQQIIEKLTQQIEELKKQLAQLQMQIAFQTTNQTNQSCSLAFGQDLYYGLTSSEVKCLQQFLANLGESIYPGKLITGYYGPLTQAAVQRYQALKGIITTGYFGPLTRAAINQN
jgi:murein L,D-transpeptidase YcbB/YkuD